MSSRTPTVSASGKDGNRQNVETKAASATPVVTSSMKLPGPGIKLIMSKAVPKEQWKEMSPPGEWELLGSLTTQQQQRTSARVIKKLKLEPLADKKKRSDPASDEIPECDTPNKTSEELKFPVKQRMPKALWSTDEKNLFFEALNEYGKDFDAITSYICAKMKKKGMLDVNLKTKTQVSHFYYRTWHKLSKHVRFDENVKKVAQELYALINYGELRKKLASVNEKTCARLGEMVLGGSIVVRARGRNLRVRTPMCRALRRLNQITERACGSRVMARASVSLRARDAACWARVQAAAHNPRLLLLVPPAVSLRALIAALAARWQPAPGFKSDPFEDTTPQDRDQVDSDNDVILTEDGKTLHVGPRLGAEVHLPVVRPSAQLSSQNICFSSYLQRMAPRGDPPAKIRTPKRQRKDSTTEKDKEVDQKKARMEEDKLINIEDTAIDGIELMASYKNNIEEGPSTEDEKEVKEDDLRVPVEEDIEKDEKEYLKEREDVPRTEEGARERDRDMSEKEKDSFSEMEDDEKYNKSDTDNESDHGKGKDRKFNNLKVKFRIRPKKRGGSIYTLVMDSDKEERDEKPDIDVDLALRQIRAGWSARDAGELTVGDAYLMFGSRSRLELDYWWAEPSPPLPQKPRQEPVVKNEKTEKNEKTKLEKTDKIEKNDRSKTDKVEKLEKNEKTKTEKTEKTKVEKTEKTEKTPDKGTDSSVEDEKGGKESDTDIFSPKNTFSQDSNDGSGDERKGEQPWSPEHKVSNSRLMLASKLVNRPRPYPPPDTGFSALSERLKRLLCVAGNPAASKARCAREWGARGRAAPAPAHHVFRPPAPIAPRPDHESVPPLDLCSVPRARRGRARVPERRVVVQRLLPLLPKLPQHTLLPVKLPAGSAPARILPKPPPTSTTDLSFFYVLSESNGQFYFHDGDRRIPITQPNQESPVKDDTAVEEDSTPESSSDNKDFKSDIAKEFTISSENLKSLATCSDAVKDPTISSEILTRPSEVLARSIETGNAQKDVHGSKKENANDPKLENTFSAKSEALEADNVEGRDVGSFLSQESMSLSPSRLLRDAEWLEGGVHDFSLSSFLGQLEGRAHHDRTVDSQLHSLMAESSVDYVAKFADLAAEVTDEVDPIAADDLT